MRRCWLGVVLISRVGSRSGFQLRNRCREAMSSYMTYKNIRIYTGTAAAQRWRRSAPRSAPHMSAIAFHETGSSGGALCAGDGVQLRQRWRHSQGPARCAAWPDLTCLVAAANRRRRQKCSPQPPVGALQAQAGRMPPQASCLCRGDGCTLNQGAPHLQLLRHNTMQLARGPRPGSTRSPLPTWPARRAGS
jgi:hypothetical protein